MTTASIPVEEYLTSDYSPDREYVDGAVVERNLGELDHSNLQKKLIIYLWPFESRLNAKALPEQRVQVKPDRYRVPDVLLLKPGHPREQIITSPPLACFEILSPEDRVSQMHEKIADYLEFGITYVWVLDPRKRKAFRCLPGQMIEVLDGTLRTENPEIVLNLDELFA